MRHQCANGMTQHVRHIRRIRPEADFDIDFDTGDAAPGRRQRPARRGNRIRRAVDNKPLGIDVDGIVRRIVNPRRVSAST